MSQSQGKVFEKNFKASVPNYMWYYRPPDQVQAFGGDADNLRFSAKSPCDCFIFNGEKLFTLELKSVGGTSVSFERNANEHGVIHKHQIDTLLKFAKYKNIVSGFILNFRLSENTYFLFIEDFCRMSDILTKKSFNEKDLFNYCSPVLINQKRLRVNYRYDVEGLVKSITKQGEIEK